VFCYNPVDFARRESELSTDDLLRVLRQGRELGAVQLGLSGGEPLVRDDLEVIVAEAYRDAQKTKGEGDAKASAIFADAFGRDPQFAKFYRSLEAYRASFRTKSDVMVVDPNSEFFQAMRGGPATPAIPAASAARAKK